MGEQGAGGGGFDRREFLKRFCSGAVAMGAAGCLPHVDGDWGACMEADGGTPPAPASNRVVEVVSETVVDRDELVIARPELVPEMVRAGLLALTGTQDLAGAWNAILPDRKSEDVVGLKVSALLAARVKSSREVVGALTDSLRQDAGVDAEQVVVWDRTSNELQRAGLVQENLGVRCLGTLVSHLDPSGPGYEKEAVCLSGRKVYLSTLLTRELQHLINVPVLKNHKTAAFTGCLKSHYGSFSRPGDFHNDCDQHIARLNALPQITGISRLQVMDALISVCWGDTEGPKDNAPGRILFSFDPVATDRRGVEIRDEMCALAGRPPGTHPGYLDLATQLGLGAAEYQLVRVEI